MEFTKDIPDKKFIENQTGIEKFFVEKGVKFSDEKIEFVSIDEETLKKKMTATDTQKRKIQEEMDVCDAAIQDQIGRAHV